MCGPAGFGSALRFIATKMSARDTTRSVPRKSHLDFTPACSYSRSMEVNRSGTDGTDSTDSHFAGDATEALMGPRKDLVLTAIVENYIATGDPVASQAIARQQNREGMSAATVRNVMADLSEAGYLEQPHTSAGRIPTAQAFRYYVEQLLRRKSSPHQALPQPTQEQIEESFSGVASATDFFARTSHILALLSGGVGVGLGVPIASADWELLEHVHFARLGNSRVLTVLVTTAGVVRDRLLTLEHDLSPSELETAANYLNQNFHGWGLESIRKELTRRMDRERREYDQVLCSLELWAKGAMNPSGDRNAQEKSDLCRRRRQPDGHRSRPEKPAGDISRSRRETTHHRSAERLRRQQAAFGARGGGPGRKHSGNARPGADRRPRAPRCGASGNGRRRSVHSNAVCQRHRHRHLCRRSFRPLGSTALTGCSVSPPPADKPHVPRRFR